MRTIDSQKMLNDRNENTIDSYDIGELLNQDKTKNAYIFENGHIEAGLNGEISIKESSYWEAIIGAYADGRISSHGYPENKHLATICSKKSIDINEFVTIVLKNQNELDKVEFFIHISQELREACIEYLNGDISLQDTLKADMVYWKFIGDEVHFYKRYSGIDTWIKGMKIRETISEIKIGNVEGYFYFYINGNLVWKEKNKFKTPHIVFSTFCTEEYEINIINDVSLSYKESVIYLNPVILPDKLSGNDYKFNVFAKGSPTIQVFNGSNWMDVSSLSGFICDKPEVRMLLKGNDKVYKLVISV